jgi:hypothetical protein
VELREEALDECITCDCDNNYVDIIKEVMGLCNHEQVKALCSSLTAPTCCFDERPPLCRNQQMHM